MGFLSEGMGVASGGQMTLDDIDSNPTHVSAVAKCMQISEIPAFRSWSSKVQ